MTNTFGHKNIIDYCQRPWPNVDAMNEGLIENWNRVVAPEDTVYVLGDFAFMNLARQAEILARLKGWKILVKGNHDRSAESMLRAGFDLVRDVPGGVLYETADLKARLCHFPYVDLHFATYDDRFLSDMPTDDGGWLLHGHVHQGWKQKGRQINVGVDVWGYMPVSADHIAAIVSGEIAYHGKPRLVGGERPAEATAAYVMCTNCGMRQAAPNLAGLTHNCPDRNYDDGPGLWVLQPGLFE